MVSVPDEQKPLGLTDFQVQVARLFVSLPEAAGLLLAGGAGLVAQAHDRGWTIEKIRDEATFCRLVVHGNKDPLVDLALDSPPEHPATASLIGPTFAPRELAGRKVVALFDRAEARGFADVFELSQHFFRGDLLAEASEVDRGFDRHIFARMLRRLARFSDADLPAPKHASQ